MKIARQAERSVIITFIFAGSKRPGEKRERERGGWKKARKRTTKLLSLLVYLCILLGSSLWNPITASASYSPPPRPLMLPSLPVLLSIQLLPHLPYLSFIQKSKRRIDRFLSPLQRGERRNVKGNKKRKRGRRSVRGRKEGCKLAVRHGVVAPVRACIILAIFHRVIPFRRRNLHSPFLPAAEISGERGRPGFAAKLFRTSCQPVCTYICMKCPFPSI